MQLAAREIWHVEKYLNREITQILEQQSSKLLEFLLLKMLKMQLGSQATRSRFEANPALSQELVHVTSRVPSNLNHFVML